MYMSSFNTVTIKRTSHPCIGLSADSLSFYYNIHRCPSVCNVLSGTGRHAQYKLILNW